MGTNEILSQKEVAQKVADFCRLDFESENVYDFFIEKRLNTELVEVFRTAANMQVCKFELLIRPQERQDCTDNISDPFEKLDSYTRNNPGKPVSELVKELFPEIGQKGEAQASQNGLIHEKRELWIDRQPEDKTPGHFIDRVYYDRGPDFHTGRLQKLDKTLSITYDRWRKKGAPGAPEGFRHLPSSDEVKTTYDRPPTEEERLRVARWRSREQRAQTRDR